MTISIKSIKKTMDDLYQALIERNDESYLEFYSSLRTLRSLNLISEEDFKKIYEHDDFLFIKYN